VIIFLLANANDFTFNNYLQLGHALCPLNFRLLTDYWHITCPQYAFILRDLEIIDKPDRQNFNQFHSLQLYKIKINLILLKLFTDD
jgi:hypothetical protein